MKSSISAELEGLVEGDTQMIHTAIQYIKTNLLPKLRVITEQNPVVLQICQPPHVIMPSKSWNYYSDPFMIDNTYMVKLKLEIQCPGENSSPAKKGLKYKMKTPVLHYTAIATLYSYRDQCSNENHKTLTCKRSFTLS